MAQSTISVRVDEDTKNRFERFCSELGMNATVAVNMFIRTALRENRIPFELKASDPISQQEWLKEALVRKGIPVITLEDDGNGNAFIDKDKYPDLYDWAVNG
jgi:DNA-damage-inducible protein J